MVIILAPLLPREKGVGDEVNRNLGANYYLIFERASIKASTEAVIMSVLAENP